MLAIQRCCGSSATLKPSYSGRFFRMGRYYYLATYQYAKYDLRCISRHNCVAPASWPETVCSKGTTDFRKNTPNRVFNRVWRNPYDGQGNFLTRDASASTGSAADAGPAAGLGSDSPI